MKHRAREPPFGIGGSDHQTFLKGLNIMVNETALTPVEVEGVHGYVDNEGTAWLKLDDCARGLGITQRQNKNGKVYESIRWSTVRKYLDEIGFPQEVGEELAAKFIPEHVFYRLGMKVNNPIGNAFQDKIARVILPAIRKHGFYAEPTLAPTAQMTIFNNAVKDIGETAKNLELVFGVDKGIALAKATQIAEDAYKMNFNSLRGLLPSSEHSDSLFNPTGIGKILGITAEEVNNRLEKLGLQVKSEQGRVLTEDGKSYGAAFPFVRNGHSGFQIRWFRKVVDVIRKSIVEEEI